MEMLSFCWQIPTSPLHLDLLCGGYIGHLIPSIVHNNMKDLCVHYLNDSDTINEIKNCKPGTSFKSGILVHNEAFCKWILQIYPKGTDENSNGYPVIRLVLISMSPIISIIECQCNISIPEINYSSNDIRCSFAQYLQFSDLGEIIIEDSYWKDLKILTFNLTISNINIEYNDNQILPIDNKLRILSTKYTITDSFKCTVNNTETSDSVLFKMHSLSWCLKLLRDTNSNRDGRLIKIELLTLPPHCSAYFYYDLISKDIGWKKHDHILFKGWSLVKRIRSNALLTKNICNLKFITIDLMITLIDIFDKNGNNITNRYIHHHKPAQKITVPPSSHYKWKIPAISTNDALLICNGYIREKCMNINIYIPFDISQLITLFFDDGKYAVDQVKNAKNSEGFKSDIFKIEGIKFYLDIYPRGYDTDITSSKTTVEAYLNMVSISTNIVNIICWYKWRMCELDTFNENSFRFNCSSLAANASGDELSVTDIQNVESLTFALDLLILGVFDQKGCPLDDYHKYQETNVLSTYIDHFEWKIDKESMINAEDLISDTFDMHSLKWALELIKDENDSDLWVKLKLMELSSNIRVWVNMILKCEDIDYMEQTEGVEFWKDNMEDTTPLIETFERNRDITFKLIIELTDVYDENGYCITDQYSESNQLK